MSEQHGLLRKVFDQGPAQVSSNSSYNGSGSPTTGWTSGILTTPIWLTPFSQSVNDNGRIGIAVAAETLDLRVQITPDVTVTGVQHIRMIVFSDNECDGAFPAVTDLLGDTGQLATTVASGICMSFLQPAYFGRFKIIEDKNWKIVVPGSPNVFQDTQCHPLWHESHHNLKKHRIMWDTTDGNAIANARRGHIFVMFFYENIETTGGIGALLTTTPPAIHYTSRIRYVDEL